MLDGVTLDQLRTFLAAAEEGSFSAAGRRLGRAQSVVSQTLANLEAQLQLQLFDRTGRLPVLTDGGRALLPQAREVAADMDRFKARAASLAGGVEAQLSIVVDMLFPLEVFAAAIGDFQTHFPDTALKVDVEAMGAVLEPLIDGRSSLAITGSLPEPPPSVLRERLLSMRMLFVASAHHPLAQIPGRISRQELSRHVQIVMTDRSTLTQGQGFGVISPRVWRVADVGSKHAFLRAGLGWGGMPWSHVGAEVEAGLLVEILLEDGPDHLLSMPMFAAHRADTPPGPAGRWLIERLKDTTGRCAPEASQAGERETTQPSV